MFPHPCRAFARVFLVAALAAIRLTTASARAENSGSFSCPVLGSKIEAVNKDTEFSDYKGIRYYYCCAGCKPQFEKAAEKFLKQSREKNKDRVIGVSLFDPITTKRLDPQKATAHSDFNGVRYFFAKEDDKTTFDKEPKKYTVAPKKEVLFCPVRNAVIDSYADAADYSDVNGTRYYFCCAGCKPKFDQNPDKYLNGLEERMKAEAQKKGSP